MQRIRADRPYDAPKEYCGIGENCAAKSHDEAHEMRPYFKMVSRVKKNISNSFVVFLMMLKRGVRRLAAPAEASRLGPANMRNLFLQCGCL